MELPIKYKAHCIFFFLVVAGWVSWNASSASAQSFTRRTYGYDDGLPSQLKSIVQDSLGYIWVASDMGLSRFDGTRVTTFPNATASTYVKRFYHTRKNQLLALHDAGITFIKPNLDTVAFENPLPADFVWEYPKSFFEDSNGNWWIGERSGIVKWTQGKTPKRYTFPSRFHSDKYIRSFEFAERANGELWASAEPGQLLIYHPEKDVFDQIELPESLGEIATLTFLNENELLLGADHLLRLSIGEKNTIRNVEVLKEFDSGVLEITSYQKNHFLISTWSEGVYILFFINGKPLLFEVKHANGPDQNTPLKQVKCIRESQQEGFWVVTEDQLHLYTPAYLGKPQNELGLQYIQSITTQQNGDFLIMSNSQPYKVNFSSQGTGIMELPKPETKRDLISVAESASGDLWLGGSAGFLAVKRHDEKTFKEIKLPEAQGEGHLFNILTDSSENLWICQDPTQGILRYSKDGNLKIYGAKEGLTSRSIQLLLWKEQLFIGGMGDSTYLFKYRPQFDDFVNLSVPLPFHPKEFVVNDFAVASENSFYLGTNLGLWKLEKDQIEKIPLNISSQDNVITSLALSQEGGIWVGTAEGIVFIGNEQEAWINDHENMASRNVNYRAMGITKNGKIWIGTPRGMLFSQRLSKSFATTSQPIILELRINGAKQLVSKMARQIVSHENSFIEFTVGSLTYPTDRLMYQYKILPTDQEWRAPSTSGRVILNESPEGNYQIMARALLPNGSAWSSPLSVEVIIRKQWYKRWWARLLFIVAAGFIVFISARGYNYRLKKQQSLLQRLIKERTKEISSKNQILQQQKEEIETLNAYLEDKVKERTKLLEKSNSALSNEIKDRINAERDKEKLIQELMKKNEDLLQFSYIISHNLRGSIARILGLTYLFGKGQPKDDQDIIDRLMKDGKRLDDTVKDLSDVITIRDNHTINRETLSVQKSLQFATDTLKESLEKHQVTITADLILAPEVFFVKGYLDSIFYNLISNAIKYRQEGITQTIQVTSKVVGDYTCIEFADNGLGIDLEQVGNKVFKMYQRFHPEIEGKGIGLYLIKTQLEAFGGRIMIKSALNQGTTFFLYFENEKKQLQKEEN